MKVIEILFWVLLGAVLMFVALGVLACMVQSGKESRKEEEDDTRD